MISVIVPNYNGKGFLKRCLDSINGQTYQDLEVIVVDNASSDGSADYLKCSFPWVKVVRNRENLGFAGGTNSGIRASQGEFVLTLNNDTWAEEHFVERLIEPMADRSVGMCASKMLLPDGRIASTGICLSRSGAAWDRGAFEPDEGRYDQQLEVFGPCAGAGLYRREMLDEIGLFDEDFFLYMEDVDMALRARLAGWRCIYVPEAIAYHYHGGTAGAGSDLAVYFGNRNVIWYAVKGFPSGLLLSSLPWIIGRNLAVIPYYALRGQGRVILKSKLDSLLGLPGVLEKRRSVLRRARDSEIKKFVRTWSEIKRP
jgi:GT2 family glycosyltransferase